jgi:N-acetylneuraminic acid mutarotase
MKGPTKAFPNESFIFMKMRFLCCLLIIMSGFLFAMDEPKSAPAASSKPEAKPEAQMPSLPALPSAVTGNAVAVLRSRGTTLLFSFMGIGSRKTWDAVTNTAFYLDPDWDQWYPLKPVPGTAGRIAASAAAAHGAAFVLGGAVVDDHNRQMVVPDVNVYELRPEHWTRGADMPIPVADSMAGLYRDRYIYMVGGRSNSAVVSAVQIYDTDKARWLQGTPLPGPPVFGHSGALLDDTMVVVDGATQNSGAGGPRFIASNQCWIGKIDHHDPTKIEWSKLPPHPGDARFGIAAGASSKERRIYFSGGTSTPDSPSGMSFEGKPSEPSALTFAFDLRSGHWEVVDNKTPKPVMNSRGLLSTDLGLAIVGGMEKDQKVISRVPLVPYVAKDR